LKHRDNSSSRIITNFVKFSPDNGVHFYHGKNVEIEIDHLNQRGKDALAKLTI